MTDHLTPSYFSRVPGVPDGWVLLRVGVPNLGDDILSYDGIKKATEIDIEFAKENYPVPIIAFDGAWRPAHAKMQMPREARFRDTPKSSWTYGTVVSHRRANYKWKDDQGRYWPICEVKNVEVPAPSTTAPD